MKLDPVTLEVVRNALPAISNEMSYDLRRTSYNMMIYELDLEATRETRNVVKNTMTSPG
jgi:N-methylhydantoinase B/oxoprolinase/acetone carboxylase alpha subunit